MRLTSKKLGELQEIGWHRLISLLLVTVKVTKSSQSTLAATEKMISVLETRSLPELNIRHIHTQMKGLATLSLLLLDRHINPKLALEAFMKRLDYMTTFITGQNRCKDSLNESQISKLVQKGYQSYAELLQDSCYSKNCALALSKSVLINSNVGKYLRVCHSNDVKILLSAFIIVSTKLRRVQGSLGDVSSELTEEEMGIKSGVLETQARKSKYTLEI